MWVQQHHIQHITIIHDILGHHEKHFQTYTGVVKQCLYYYMGSLTQMEDYATTPKASQEAMQGKPWGWKYS